MRTHVQLLSTNTLHELSEAFKTSVSRAESRNFSLSSALVKSRKIAPLSAPPHVPVVLLLVPQTGRCVMTLGHEPPLGAEVAVRVVLTLEAAALVVLEAKFVRLK